jgi:hypothetical protein
VQHADRSIVEFVGEDAPSNSTPSIDHNTAELPFSALGGRRFEILGYLLEIDHAQEIETVTLVQSSADKGRDILVHQNGTLVRMIQCKNLLKKVGKSDLLQELIKLLLNNEVELPDGPLKWTVLEKTSAADPKFEERSVDDAISQDLLGKSVGDKFVLVPGMVDRLGEIVQILPKFVRRFQNSMTEMPVRFPSEAPNFQSVRKGGPDGLDPGIAAVLASVRERAEQVKSLQELYLSQPIPVHLYAKRFGKNAYEGIMHSAETESVSVKCSHSDQVAFAAAVSSLETAKSVVLDLSAIATIHLRGIDDLLSSQEFVLSQDSAMELRETLIDDEPERQGGTMVYNDNDGRYSLYEEQSEQRKDRIKRDKEFCEAILAKTIIKPHLGLASVEQTQRETLIKFLGEYGTEAVIVTTEPDTILWTDDLTQGDLATSMFGVRRV